MEYRGISGYQHGSDSATGVLITNLGTPDAPTKEALKPYLREFLMDPRVVEPPPSRWVWRLILEGIILNTRPAKSAEAYATVWDSEGPGSPLLNISNRQLGAIAERLTPHFAGRVEFALGMRYGNPSIASALQTLQDKGCQRIIVLPLYPQYAAATSASTMDAVSAELQTWRWVPDLRFVSHYHRHPGYIKALANSVLDHQEIHGKPQKLVMSYHGVPQRYHDNGDPYYCECHTTSRLLARELGLNDDEYMVTFQSLFGKEEWIKPYTDATMKSLPSDGIKNVQVICPGFSADCLETIEEIGEENREYFEDAGGEKFSFIRCLNDRADHADALTDVLLQNLQGWLDAGEDEAERLLVKTQAKTKGCPF
ncbi:MULTISPECIES: ferrochelatase [Thiomicrorhabdus]|uniref:Ferrochelatase n=1 Tax=Thiomicrorhabdus heinhorstiae TaxID=2748010 RepID=A0ABS0BXC7_9GAMM|nr:MULTISPECIES: ferrochelatase [Thiomicrorhabdus]MBF6057659.1 ferrochelatase [Thiomicrorhabdus heinhorstiae]